MATALTHTPLCLVSVVTIKKLEPEIKSQNAQMKTSPMLQKSTYI